MPKIAEVWGKGKEKIRRPQGQETSDDPGLYPPAANLSNLSPSKRFPKRRKTDNVSSSTGIIDRTTQQPETMVVSANPQCASNLASTHPTTQALTGEQIATATATATATDTEMTDPPSQDAGTPLFPEASTKNQIPSLWERALNDPGLSMQDRQTLHGVQIELQSTTSTVEVLESFRNFMNDVVDKRQRKDRKFTFRGMEISMKDVRNKIIAWVDKFKEIGDIIIQYDPVHAALPWAGFRFLLKVCVDKNKSMEAILIGLEKMTFLIDQCSLYEWLYLNHNTEASRQLGIHMLRLYVAILKFLANAIDRSRDNRIQAIFMLDDVSQHLQKVEEIEKTVERYAQIAENQNIRTDLQNLKALLQELKTMNSSLQPQLKAIQQHLEYSRRSKILKWISEIPYTEHHRRISHERLEGTGTWLLARQEYSDWRHSDNSKLLLLGGIPGAGKTYTASTVIDYYLQETERLAYFYCNRAEEDRRDPQKILATIIQQLSQTESKEGLLKPVVKIYEDREAKGQTSARLSLPESQDLLVQLADLYPDCETTICIDAMDEVNNQTRRALLEALKDVINRSRSVIKIFVTTRMDTDILKQFKIFPLIELQPDDNATDINSFIKMKVESFLKEKEWDNNGYIEDELKEEIYSTLQTRCKGNFQLAALQIQLFYQLDFKEDIQEALEKLPDTLLKAYDEIYQNIRSKPSRSARLALNAFRWIQCSYSQLQSEELLQVVNTELSSTGEISTISTVVQVEMLLTVCQNFVILDKNLNVFRFAHLSVDEYLQTKLPKEDSHLEIVSICLSILCTDHDAAAWDIHTSVNDRGIWTVDDVIKRKHFLLFYSHVVEIQAMRCSGKIANTDNR